MVIGCYRINLAQNNITVHAKVNPESHKISIVQSLTYVNTQETPVNYIVLNDWTSSYSDSDTPLVKKFLNEFQTHLYIAKDKDRGFTRIESITDSANNPVQFQYVKEHKDLLKVFLKTPLNKNQKVNLNFDYVLKIQSDRFTSYGISKEGNFNLNAWYFTPAVFDGSNWKLYSNLNFDDPYCAKSNVQITVDVPSDYHVHSALKLLNLGAENKRHKFQFSGSGVKSHNVYITTENFKSFKNESTEVLTDIHLKRTNSTKENEIISRVHFFLKQQLYEVSTEKLVLTNVDLKKNSLYGLALLPDFLSPFPKDFKYEILIAKNLIKKQLDQHMNMDPRRDYWLQNGFQMLLLIKYLETYHPKQKLIGKLADFWGVRSYNFAKLNFKDQYRLTYYQMMRTGRDQALSTPKHRLLSFNERFTSYYKAAIALLYLESYLDAEDAMMWVSEFTNNQNNKQTTIADFETYIKSKTNKNTDWFFKEFTNEFYAADYKIKSISKSNDSVFLKLKNLKKGSYPVSLSSFENNMISTHHWIDGFENERNVVLPKSSSKHWALNYRHQTPEFNRKNNWKSMDSYGINKPLQIRFLRDYQNPNYNQLNIMPVTEFQNVYDGFKFGINFNNRGVLAKQLIYIIAPSYGTKSKTLTGNAKLIYNKFHENGKLYNTMMGLTTERNSFNYGAFFRKFQSFAQFTFRSRENLRSNSSDLLQLRYINIQKDNSSDPLDENTIPPYQIFNIRYNSIDNNIADYKNWYLGLQLSNKFGKINFNYEIRKRTPKDRHYNLRLFAGGFIYNSLPFDENNFDYALDRPSNYLFEYNYLGQSESSGILSQQFINAEGGFKSKLNPATANQWLTSLNASASIWRYVQAYGDIGLVKNRGYKPYFAYDSGIRLDLIIDYFELYFPVQSNLGWEITQSNYPQKIRFVFTTDISKLTTLFTRKWF